MGWWTACHVAMAEIMTPVIDFIFTLILNWWSNPLIPWMGKMIIHVWASQIYGIINSLCQYSYSICCLEHRLFFSMTVQKSNFTPTFDIFCIISLKLKILNNWLMVQLSPFLTILQYHGLLFWKCRIYDLNFGSNFKFCWPPFWKSSSYGPISAKPHLFNAGQTLPCISVCVVNVWQSLVNWFGTREKRTLAARDIWMPQLKTINSQWGRCGSVVNSSDVTKEVWIREFQRFFLRINLFSNIPAVLLEGHSTSSSCFPMEKPLGHRKDGGSLPRGTGNVGSVHRHLVRPTG